MLGWIIMLHAPEVKKVALLILIYVHNESRIPYVLVSKQGEDNKMCGRGWTPDEMSNQMIQSL